MRSTRLNPRATVGDVTKTNIGLGSADNTSDVNKPVSTAQHAANVVRELCARMTVRPTRARRTLMTSLITSLITAGVWDKLDGLYLFAAHDVQAAKLNWVGCLQDVTAVNAPVFQIDRGFTGNGTSSYLDTGMLPSALERFASADASMGVYNRTNGGSTYDMSAGGGAYLTANNGSSQTVLRANGGTLSGNSVIAIANGGALGLFSWSRDASNVAVYKGATLLTSAAVQTVAVSTADRVMFMRDGAGSNWSNHQLAAGFIGQGLSATETAALNTALLAYLTPIGAN